MREWGGDDGDEAGCFMGKEDRSGIAVCPMSVAASTR